MSPHTNSAKNPNPAKVSLLKDLLQRRVPHILGAYLAGGWVIIEFMDWLVRRYPISPYLVEFCLVALAAMIPTVLLLAYFHGKPGRDQWTRVEKIGIPSNLVVTGFLLIFLFHGRDLGATTTTVSLVDEQGKQIERQVPKSEFRKKVAVFSMENESGDDELDWLVHALPDMLNYDLSQDIYLDIISVYGMYEEIRDKGYPDAVNVPMTLKKEIAAEQYMDYFTIGKIRKQEGIPSIYISLHDTKTSKLLAEETFTGEDISNLVDEISVWLKHALQIPKVHIDNTVDLPVAEILSGSIPALKDLYAGFNQYIIKGNREQGLELIRMASEEDSTFAYAYIHLYAFHMFNTNIEASMQALQSVMEYLHKVPEHTRFSIMHDYYYQIKQDPKLSLDVARNWAELYPDDIQAHKVLAMRYVILNQKENELAEYKKIIHLDPGQYEFLLKIGDIYKGQGKFDDALEYYQSYADAFPNHPRSYTKLGDLFVTYGAYEEAGTYYNKALLIEPRDISIQISLANIQTELGNFSKAIDDFKTILENCVSPQERYEVYKHLENHFFLRGQFSKGIEYMERKIAEQEKYDVPIEVLSNRIDAAERYVKAGKTAKALEIIQNIEKQLRPPFDYLVPIGYLIIYLEMEDPDSIGKYLLKVIKYTEDRQLQLFQKFISFARGRQHELKGEYDLAIQQYLDVLNQEPANKSMHYPIGRCYRKKREYKKAESHILELLAVHPCWPEELYEMGLVYADWGKNDKALEYFGRANRVWEDADTSYAMAMEARRKWANLKETVY
jgi:tetratricopeptide (TPR) repeat protein